MRVKINLVNLINPISIVKNDPFSSFMKINLDFIAIGGMLSSSLALGLEGSYFKNGILFDSEFNFPLVGKNRYFWEKYERVKINFGTKASPVDPKFSIYSRIGMTYPISKKVKTKTTNIGIGRSRGITFASKAKLKRLSTWGVRADLEFDRSFKQHTSIVEKSTILDPKTNDLMISIANPLFSQSSANISLGVSKSTFLNFTIVNNDNRFSKSEVNIMYFDMYLVAKYNLYHSYSDMVIFDRTSNINGPIVFNELEFNNLGFAAGFNVTSVKNFKGFSLGFEIGKNPHLKYDNWLDLYAKAKIGYTISKK